MWITKPVDSRRNQIGEKKYLEPYYLQWRICIRISVMNQVQDTNFYKQDVVNEI